MKFLFLLTLLTFVLGCHTQVVQLTDENFDQLVKKSDQWVIEFYADWCGYCKQFSPKFDLAEETLRKSSYNTVYFGKVNIDENPALAARFFVSRLPTLFHIDRRQVRVLPIPRDISAFVDSLNHEEWKTIDPIGGWRSPFSILGLLVGYTGYLVRKLSTVSPWLVIGLLAGLLVCSLGLTTYFAQRQASAVSSSEQEKEANDRQQQHGSRAQSTGKKSPVAQKRRSKRID